MPKNFDSLTREDNNIPLMTGMGILTADITGTPQVSPLAIDTNVVTISVPTNAAEMVVSCDVAIRISELVGMTQYFTLGASTVLALPLGRTDTIYFQTNSGSGTLQFYFVTV